MREVAESESLSRTTLHLGKHKIVAFDDLTTQIFEFRMPTLQESITWTYSWIDIKSQSNG